LKLNATNGLKANMRVLFYYVNVNSDIMTF